MSCPVRTPCSRTDIDGVGCVVSGHQSLKVAIAKAGITAPRGLNALPWRSIEPTLSVRMNSFMDSISISRTSASKLGKQDPASVTAAIQTDAKPKSGINRRLQPSTKDRSVSTSCLATECTLEDSGTEPPADREVVLVSVAVSEAVVDRSGIERTVPSRLHQLPVTQ